MEILIRNQNGRFEIGGGKHSVANLLEISGIGLLEKSFDNVVFSGQAGCNVYNSTDKERIITLSLDIVGTPSDIMNMYSVLQEKCELIFFANGERKRIWGICLNASEAESIIAKRMYKIVLQFTCEQPYFEDFSEKVINVSARTNMFPSYFRDGAGVIDLSITPIATTRTTEAKIINRGNVDIRPIIEIVFEETSEGFEIKNKTSQKSIKVNKSIATGETITVDCDSRKIVSNIDGSIINKLDDLTYMSEFFIGKGENDVDVTNNKNNKLVAKVKYRNKYKAVVAI